MTLASLSSELAALAASAAPSLVRVHARRGPAASGFIWKSGLVVTADEAVEVDEGLKVTLPDGSQAEAMLAGRDPSTDLAILRCAGAQTALAVPANASAVAPGQLAIALGRGRHGMLSRLAMIASTGDAWQSEQGGRIDSYLGLDLRFDRHLEGGVLLSVSGGFLGLIAAGPRHTHLAIPAATIERVLPQLEAKGRIARGYLGAGLQAVKVPAEAGDGEPRRAIMVVGLDDKGPAKVAGLMQGDILLSWNGQAVASVRDVAHRLGTDTPGTAADLAISRAGVPSSLRLIIGERPTT